MHPHLFTEHLRWEFQFSFFTPFCTSTTKARPLFFPFSSHWKFEAPLLHGSQNSVIFGAVYQRFGCCVNAGIFCSHFLREDRFVGINVVLQREEGPTLNFDKQAYSPCQQWYKHDSKIGEFFKSKNNSSPKTMQLKTEQAWLLLTKSKQNRMKILWKYRLFAALISPQTLWALLHLLRAMQRLVQRGPKYNQRQGHGWNQNPLNLRITWNEISIILTHQIYRSASPSYHPSQPWIQFLKVPVYWRPEIHRLMCWRVQASSALC